MSVLGQSIALPEALLAEAARHAEQLGVSTEKWISIALEDKIRRDAEDAEDLAMWQAWAPRPGDRSMMEILALTNDNPPDPGDELPDGWAFRSITPEPR